MPSFQYAQSKNMVQTQPVQYNVQPNLSASRAFEKLQQGLMAGAQLKSTLDENAYRDELAVLTKDVEELDIKWKASDYDTKQNELLPQIMALQERYPVDGNRYDQQLASKATTLANNYRGALAEEGVVKRFRDNELMLIKGAQDLTVALKEAEDVNAREELVATFDQQFVQPYEGLSDKYSQSLLTDALKLSSSFKEGLLNERIAIKDQSLASEALDIISTNIAVRGVPSPELWADVNNKIKDISDYSQKERAYKNSLFNTAIYGMATYMKNQQPTVENYNSLKQQIEALAKLDPTGAASDSFRSLQTSLAGFKTTVINEKVTNLNAAINTDTISLKDTTNMSQELLDLGWISPLQHEANLFNKKTKVGDTKVYSTLNQYYQMGEEGDSLLRDAINSGKVSQVSTLVNSNLNTEFLHDLNVNQTPLNEALDKLFKKQDHYIRLGVTPKSFPVIDEILTRAQEGRINNVEEAKIFVDTYLAASRNGYAHTSINEKNMGRTLALKGLMMFAPEDQVMTLFRDSQRSTKNVDPEVLDDAFNEVFDEGFLSVNINANNRTQLKNSFEEAFKTMIRAGVNPANATDDIEAFVEANYIEGVQEGWGAGTSRIFIRKSEVIDSKAAYQGLSQAFGKDAAVMPRDPYNPTGDWIVFHKNGSVQTVLYKDAIIMAKIGKLQNSQQTQQLENGMMVAP